ncbi:MAG: hypothetical protein ABEK42_00775 [Thiohalorhabdaceae bacterium]
MIHVEKALAQGRQALEQGRLDEAEAELRSILEFDDYEPRALRLMGKVASLRGQPQRAAELLEKALEARDPESREAPPKGPPPTPTLAELYAGQGHTQAAAAVYRQLLAEAGDDERADEWRRRLAVLENGEAASTPAEAEAEGSPPSAAAEEGGVTGEDVDPAQAERRLRDFLDRLDGNPEVVRLRRFLDHLENRPSQ